MSQPTDIKICEAAFSTQEIAYRAPMKFGGRVVTSALIFNVQVTVETRLGKRGTGLGSMPLGNVWAWPSVATTSERTLLAMCQFAERMVNVANKNNFDNSVGHPLEIMHEFTKGYQSLADEIVAVLEISEPMPVLAQLVAASPLDAAIHDAYGHALRTSSYRLLGREFVGSDLSNYLNSDFAGEYLDQYVLAEPKARMPLYHLVGALDPLTNSDILQRLNDGLPETLSEWILADGLTHLKIKLNGDDLRWDIERVVAIDAITTETQRQRGCANWCYSLDFNERCANVEYVLAFLAGLKEKSAAAFDRVQYIEQPTHRDLKANPENRMHAAAQIKPVVIDESLVDFESLLLARELGYSGVALKACKGHGEALLMGAAAQKYGMFLCVQDLTCPGASFLHSASLAARIPTVAAIEGNGRQYCPAGNRDWVDQFPGMFHVYEGTIATGELNGSGLWGSS